MTNKNATVKNSTGKNLNGDHLPIRVLIVDDSAFMRTALSRMISSDPALQVAGTAANGLEALERIPVLHPDVVTLDVHMPGLDGAQTLKRIMAECPRPVVVVSSMSPNDAEITFHALQEGAFDYVPKQLSSSSLDILHIREDLITKIKAAVQSWRRRASVLQPLPPRKPPLAAEPRAALPRKDFPASPLAIIALGISTGGPKALQEILPLLPRALSVPLVIVQHMPAGFTGPFAKRLNSLCAVSVCEASHNDSLEPGMVYIAPSGVHLTVERTGPRASICLSEKPLNQLHTPSVDIMMKSVAAAFPAQAMGIIMTGMGADGSLGMRAIHECGGLTVGQDEPSCAVYGMPRVCAEMGILDHVVPLTQIPYEVMQATAGAKRSVS
jgi:two-component system chemotaxis response regulator CheB